jgi:hypothetical protein
MEAAFDRPDANEIATVGRTNALMIMVIAGFSVRREATLRSMFELAR